MTFTPERIARLWERISAPEDGDDVANLAVIDLPSALVEIERLSGPSFQDRVKPWMIECFGPVIPFDKQERNHRFLEEALELVQACECTRGEAYQLVDYVFDREVGERSQEVGGVKVTLAALCLAQGLDEAECGETELARIWAKVEKIRAKQAAKPKNSPLPQQHYSLGAQLNEAKLELSRIKAELDEAVDALKFYSNPSDYTAPQTGYVYGGANKLWSDCGQTARSFLSRMEGRKDG